MAPKRPPTAPSSSSSGRYITAVHSPEKTGASTVAAKTANLAKYYHDISTEPTLQQKEKLRDIRGKTSGKLVRWKLNDMLHQSKSALYQSISRGDKAEWEEQKESIENDTSRLLYRYHEANAPNDQMLMLAYADWFEVEAALSVYWKSKTNVEIEDIAQETLEKRVNDWHPRISIPKDVQGTAEEIKALREHRRELVLAEFYVHYEREEYGLNSEELARHLPATTDKLGKVREKISAIDLVRRHDAVNEQFLVNLAEEDGEYFAQIRSRAKQKAHDREDLDFELDDIGDALDDLFDLRTKNWAPRLAEPSEIE